MRYLQLSVISLTLLVSACGGGGGASGDPGQPTITAGSPPGGTAGTAYPGYTFTVASGGAPPFTWSETGALPPGLDLNSAGQLTGTPVTAGTFAFTVTVADSSSPTLTATLPVSLKIEDSPIVVDPGQTPPAGVHGSEYYYYFVATGGSAPLSWTVTAGTLPPGLTLSPDGTLSGTPTAASSTPYAFTLTVTDSNTPAAETTSADFSVTVSEPPPPTIYDTSPPTAIVGSPYSYTFSASDGLAPFVWTVPSAPMGGLAISSDGILSGTPSTAGIFPITLTVTDALNQSSPATRVTIHVAMARPPAAFTSTGNMTIARDGHTATLLIDGRVLITGGGPAYAELYDPASKAFRATGTMLATQGPRSATLLANSTLPNYGKVLIAGGNEVIAELFDPTAGTFTAVGSMLAPHLGQTATLLQNGQVLIAGGETTSAELFDPSTGTFTATGSMTMSRAGHTATLLPDGRVLIAGGADFAPGTWPISCCGDPSAEIYDPASGTFAPTGSMSEERFGHKAALLVDGTVLVAGMDSTAELFNPTTGSFFVIGATSTGGGATATRRNDGTVLIVGGRGRTSLATANLYAPESESFVPTGSLITPRDGHTATLLVDGSVLVTGGTQHAHVCGRGGCRGSDTVLSSAELFK